MAGALVMNQLSFDGSFLTYLRTTKYRLGLMLYSQKRWEPRGSGLRNGRRR